METVIPSTTPEPATTPPTETPQVPIPPKPKKKLFFILLGLLVILLAISGAFAFSKFFSNYKVLSQLTQTSPTPVLPTPTPVPEPTADWKTYTNTKAGYQISYPPDWELKEDVNLNYPGMITISPKSATTDNMYKGSVNIWPNYSPVKTANIYDLAKAIQQAEEGLAEYSTEEFRKIGENEFWIAKGGCCMDIGKHAFTLNRLSVYRITLYNLEQSFTDSEIQIFDLILSTFKFLD